MKQIILALSFTSAVVLSSCDKNNDGQPQPKGSIQFGEPVQVGNGKARSFFEPNDNNHPETIGIAIDEAALENLPAHETFFVLPLLQVVKETTPYNHISLDWNPHGHGPATIYDKPHFDMHFYMIDEAEKNGIDTTKPELNILPDSSFLPPFYVPEASGVPKMGKHWVDITSPELNPEHPVPFTSTFVYGTYNGKVIFHEPMITRDFLLTKPDTLVNIRQPMQVRTPGHYPTKYQVRFDDETKQWRIILRDFEHR